MAAVMGYGSGLEYQCRSLSSLGFGSAILLAGGEAGMAGCIFCDIVAGRTPASLVHEDDTAVAFLDLFPVHQGHTLVIPRQHCADLTAFDPAIAGHLMQVSAALGPRLVRALSAGGFNVWPANGTVAGQQVFHLHLHILPRFDTDNFGLRFPKDYPRAADRAALDELAGRIRATE